jgi:hypothetical protein
MRGTPACAVTSWLLMALLMPAGARAQAPRADPDFSGLQRHLKAGDEVVVTIQGGTTIRGRVGALSAGQITIVSDHEPQEIPATQVSKIQRRRNGILLGALIGAGTGLAFGFALKTYAYNEGGNEAAALLLPIGIGLGAGIAIDALLVTPRTVYERPPSRRAHLSIVAWPGRVSAQASIRLGRFPWIGHREGPRRGACSCSPLR